MKKSMSKSNDDLLADSIDSPANELDLFTMLEENIALKEKIEELSAKHNSSKANSIIFMFGHFIYKS